MAEIVGLLADGQLRIPALQVERAAGARAPARPSSRSSDDLPTPLGPSTTKASPAADREAQARKDLAAAAEAGEIGPQRRIRSPRRLGPSPASRRSDENMWRVGNADQPPGRSPKTAKARDLPAMALTSVDYLEPAQKRPYKPEPSGLILAQPSRRSRPAITGACRYHVAAPRAWCRTASIRSDGRPIKMTSLDSFKCRKTSQGRQQDLRLLQPAGGREERPQGNFPPALLARRCCWKISCATRTAARSPRKTCRRWRSGSRPRPRSARSRFARRAC